MKQRIFFLVFSILSFHLTKAQWTTNETTPIVVSAATNFQYATLYSIDEEGNSFYVWTDYRKDVVELYVQKLDSKGVPQWEKDGLKIGKVMDSYQIIYTPKLIKPDGNGGAFVVWHNIIDLNKPERRNLYAQYVSKDGKTLWAENGIKMTDQELTSYDPNDGVFDLFDLKNNTLLFVFNNYNAATNDNTVYTKKLNYKGNIVAAEAKLFDSKNLETKLLYDEKNSRFLAVIKDIAADYLFQAFDATNKPITPAPAPFYQNPFGGNSRIDLFKVDAEGNAVIGRTLTGEGKKTVFAHKIGIDGKSIWGSNGINLGSNATFDIQIVPTSDGGGIATWIETEDLQRPFQAAKLKANGDILWKHDVFAPKSDKRYFLPNKLVPDGKDGAYTLWLKPKDIGYDLTIQRIDSNGTFRFGDDGLAIKDFTFYSDYRLIPHPKTGVIVLYGANKEVEDGRGGSVDLYTNYITESGKFGMDSPPSINVSANTKNAFCTGQAFVVSLTTAGGNFNLDNNFRVLLSDKTGSFAKAIEIGKDTRRSINVTTPQDSEKGTYKIKIVSTSPVVESVNTIDVNLGDAEIPAITADKIAGCAGEKFTLSTVSCQEGTIKWSNNAEGISLATTVENNTTFTAVCNIPGCKASPPSNAVIIQAIRVTSVATNTGPYVEGDEIKLSSTGGTKYEWTGPNSFVSKDQNPTLPKAKLADAGTYLVKVTDANNCFNTAQTVVQVNNILGKEKEEVNIRTFPNPTNHEIVVEFNEVANKQVNIALIDIKGAVAGERKVKTTGGFQQEIIDIRFFPRGQYLIKVSTSTQEVIKKIIIEN